MRRLATLEGHAFERIVTEATEEMSRRSTGFAVTDRVSGYWNRPRKADASVELDLVAWNQDDQVVRFGSCKRRFTKHDARALQRFRDHADTFLSSTGRRLPDGGRSSYSLRRSSRMSSGRGSRRKAGCVTTSETYSGC